MFWYRLYTSLGKYSLVGTTVKAQNKLPEHLLADEEHVYVKGQRSYIATTVSSECILGTEVSRSASEEDLTESYGVFIKEAINVNPTYSPITINTDGWFATKKSWKAIAKKIAIIECFLHGFIKIRDRAVKKLSPVFREISDKVWDCYKAETKRSFSQRMRRIKQWAIKNVPESVMKEKLLELCSNCRKWTKFYDFPKSYRTSNALDRLMKLMSRHVFIHQWFHSTIKKATLNIRAYALIYNFAPSNPATIRKYKGKKSPAERLNGFSYHDNWLQNLLISASLGGYRVRKL